jgi:CheY-like chemotaxis protein
MPATRKILIVDQSIDRKKRIGALKDRGFAVFPALRLQEARSRCRPGAYDLIIVSAQDEPETAVTFCEELRQRTPAQPVLLITAGESKDFERPYAVTDDPEALVQRVESLLGSSSVKPEEESDKENRKDEPTRASA